MHVLRFPPRPSPSVDPGAFETEALGELDALYRAALRVTRSTVEAEDLVQDTFVKAFRSRSRFEAGTNLRAWLFTILMNTWRNRRRDAGRDPVEVDSQRVEHAADTAAETASPEELLLRATLDVDLKAALDRMPALFREAVWLRDVEEFSYAEIARILAVPLGTVMSRISRGRRLLYEFLTARAAAVVPVEASGQG